MEKKKRLALFLLLSLFTLVPVASGPFCETGGFEKGWQALSTPQIENPYLVVPSPIKNMYNPGSFPDIQILTQPHCLFTSRSDYAKILDGEKPDTVASHGSLWNYDSDIPVIFYGKGIKEGYLGGEAHLSDIAPTLAYLAGVQRPAAATGQILSDILTSETATWSNRERPKVLVLFSLDQCRNDYLRVFGNAFSFLRKRIMAKGASFAQGHVDNAKTETAVSHSTVGTGTIAGLHGIVGNNVMQPDGSFPLAIDDGNAAPNNGHGDLNPHNLLVPTLADEMDRRYMNKSVVISSSSYGRACIGVAGHGAFYRDGDYTFPGADKDIVFVTNWYSGMPYTNTDYYRLPGYLNVAQNPALPVKAWLKKYYGLDIETAMWTQDLSLVDKSPFSVSDKPIGHGSGTFPWGQKYTFSYPIVKASQPEPDPLQRYQDYKAGVTVLSDKYGETVKTPFFDLWNFDLNLMAMEHERVGQDNVPDLVFFHLKSFDAVGHRYGIYSGEIYDYMYFADYMIKKVIRWLDSNVGNGNYTVVFFGDHGGTNVVGNGQWIVNEDVVEALEAQFGVGIIRKQSGDQLWLSQDVLQSNGSTKEDVARWTEANFGWVLKAYTKGEVEASVQCW